ncbi:MAG: hypothetical protein Q7S21_05865 [archaeon]|nr:hypothetical protein [archaeon]
MVLKFFKKLSSRILGIEDNTKLAFDQVNALADMFSHLNFDIETDDLKELVKLLKKKHLVDSIVVTKRNGSVIASTNGNALKEAITGTALYNYISSEIPKSQSVLIKSSDDWYMLFPFKEKMYIVRAGSNLSNIELKALAKEIEEFIDRRQEIY